MTHQRTRIQRAVGVARSLAPIVLPGQIPGGGRPERAGFRATGERRSGVGTMCGLRGPRLDGLESMISPDAVSAGIRVANTDRRSP